jgi:hypothetical protein
MATSTRLMDIEIEAGGQRMAWRATSARARAWAAAHPSLTSDIPEGVECLTSDGDLLIELALAEGLKVGAGDVRVGLC